MSIPDHDDLVPRPLPKPAQVEMVSIQPEVPEPSLIFDKSASHTKYATPKNYVSSSLQQPLQTNCLRLSSPVYRNFDAVHKQKMSPESLPAATSLYSSPFYQHQEDLHPHSRKVSFSAHSKEPEPVQSLISSPKPSDFYGPSRNLTSHNCKCNNYETEPEIRNESRLHSSSIRADFPRKMNRVPYDFEHAAQNELCSQKHCSCSGCMKEYFTGSCNLSPKEQKSNLISAEELQKAVLKFENLFLKLNYKYSKITENFVAKDEFNAVTRSYESRIHSMQDVIDSLVAKSKISRCDYCSGVKSEFRESPKALAIPQSDLLTHKKRTDSAEVYHTPHNDNIVSNTCSSSNRVTTEDPNKYTKDQFDGQQFQYKSPNCHAKVCENQPEYSSSLKERINLQKSSHPEINKECERIIQVNQPRSMRNDYGMVDPLNSESRNKPSPTGHRGNEHDAGMKNLNDDQLKLICNNIVMQVKTMVEKNPSSNINENASNINENADAVKFIKEATIEQFGKIGLNVKNLIDDNNLLLRDNDLRRTPASKMNSVPSSDVSLHMNALAMKYIANYQLDENEFGEKKSSNDLSINCNNVSIATLRYLQRHHILSEFDKPTSNNSYEQMSSTHTLKIGEPNQNNDTSFIR